MKAELGTFPKDRQQLYKILPLDTPLCIDIHIHHNCNFRCNYCFMSANPEELEKTPYRRSFMDMNLFSLIVEQIKEFPRKIKMMTVSGIGESTIHPDFMEMIRLLNRSNITDKIQVITNASMLTPGFSDNLIAAGLGELRISLQGLSEQKYMEVAKAKIDWDEFYGNICYFSRIKGNCALKVKIADTALDEGDDERFFELFGDICDAVSIEHIYDQWTQNRVNIDLKTTNSRKSRYGYDLVDLKVCRRVFTSVDILPDGSFVQNCHDRFGFERNVREKPIREQWQCKEFDEIRVDMLKGRKNQWEFCRNCEVINANWHPEDVLDGHEDEILARMQGA